MRRSSKLAGVFLSLASSLYGQEMATRGSAEEIKYTKQFQLSWEDPWRYGLSSLKPSGELKDRLDAGDRPVFILDYKSRDDKDLRDLIFVNGSLVGNFLFQEPIDVPLTGPKGDRLERKFTPAQLFVPFCREELKKGSNRRETIECGYALFYRSSSPTSNYSFDIDPWEFSVSNIGERPPYSYLAGIVVGTKPLPKKYGNKSGIVLENYLESDGRFYRQSDLIAFDENGTLIHVETIAKKEEGLPEKVAFYLDKKLTVKPHFNPNARGHVSNDLEALFTHFPMLKDNFDGYTYDGLEVREHPDETTVLFKGIPCKDIDRLAESLKGSAIKNPIRCMGDDTSRKNYELGILFDEQGNPSGYKNSITDYEPD